MPLKIITGAGGQGKTEYIVREVIRRSEKQPDRSFFVVVPEQFSLETQRKVALSHPRKGFFNINVISFNRLAYQIFDRCGHEPDDILEDLGVSLILKRILLEDGDRLTYFRKSASKPGFVDELKSALLECIGYEVAWQDLEEAGKRLEKDSILSDKCSELAFLFRRFEEETRGRFMVKEQILGRAGALMENADFLKGAVFYFDGFTGFTPVQLTFLSKLVRIAGQIVVTVTVPEEAAFTGYEDLFSLSRKTIHSLMEIAGGDQVEVISPFGGEEGIRPRFKESPELDFLARMMETEGTESQGGEPVSIHEILCANPDEEAEYILHKIEELVRTKGIRYRDCAVLTGSLESYESAMERQAKLLKIPLFTDLKMKASGHAGIETIRALFHLARKNYSYESVFRYLKSGMSSLTDQETDYLENYVISAGIRGFSMWNKPFERRLFSKSPEEVQELDRLRTRLIEETGDFYEAVRKPEAGVQDIMTALYETLIKLDYPGKLEALALREEAQGHPSRAGEYHRLFGLFISLMDKIVHIFGRDRMEPAELAQIVDAGLDELGLGIVPLSMDQVILGDLKRTRLHEIRVLFIAGVNEGIIPPDLTDRGLIHDDEKKTLSDLGLTLSQGLLEQTLEDEFYTYFALTRPQEALYFVRSSTDRDGSSLRPSPLLGEIRQYFPDLHCLCYPDQTPRRYFNREDSLGMLTAGIAELGREPGEEVSRAFRALLHYWNSSPEGQEEIRDMLKLQKGVQSRVCLSPELVDALYKKEISGSVTRLEKYISCPFSYFCTYGLELFDRDTFEMNAMDLGSLFHAALENYSRLVKESGFRFKSVPEEERQIFMDRAMDLAVEEEMGELFDSSFRMRYQRSIADRIFRRSVEILTRQLENSEFEPAWFELGFGDRGRIPSSTLVLSEDRKIRLSGIIDRVDLCEDGQGSWFRVIDYKSGTKKFSLEEFFYGMQLQLVVYMDAVMDFYEKEGKEAPVPAGFFYYQVQDPVLTARDQDEEAYLKSFSMSGYANEDPEVLKKLENREGSLISLGIRMKNDRTPYSSAAVMSTEDFMAAGRFARKKITSIGEQIYSGDITPRPYKKGNLTACSYCAFRDVCGFDPRIPGYKYRLFGHMDKDLVLNKIREEEME
ncbi:MAG: PD-(D/E)XK nuclease family protein [Eubacterium sp.]|nr:PD-(D/E)XK nuclease family protein [Eubacterium sp.]